MKERRTAAVDHSDGLFESPVLLLFSLESRPELPMLEKRLRRAFALKPRRNTILNSIFDGSSPMGTGHILRVEYRLFLPAT
jgi:hypothetical protein